MSGRRRELSALQAERQRSAQGELRVALILGDAGLGKTRLATELLPRDNELAVGLISHGSPLGGMPPLRTWADALGLHTGGLNAEGICLTCGSGLRGLPALEPSARIAHDASSCAQALRYHLVEWIPGLLAKASADRPIVLVLDDAHQGHDAVWEMLLRLAWAFPTSPLFVLATARPAQLARHRTAVEVLHALEEEALLHRVELTPISREDIRELAAEILRRDHVPPALVDWLMASAQGNPRFAAGLLEALLATGADLQAPSLDRVPDRLARWVRTEVSRLDPPALVLIELLAVIDDLVDPGDLARITGQPIEEVALALEQLVRSGMVVEQQHDRSLGYQVTHPPTREVLYTDIGGARRIMMHRQVAGTLLGAGQPKAAATHFVRAVQAGDGTAIDALIEMARRAEQRGLCSQAWTIVSTLWDLLPIGDERWLGVLDALCQQSNWSIVDRTEHDVADLAALRRVRQLVAGIGDLQRQADLRLWLGGLFALGAGDLDAAQRECQQALALCQRAGCQPATRMAAIELAKTRGWAGDLRGEELGARSLLSEAERVGDQQGIAEALGALGHTLGWQGRFDEAQDVLLRSITLATAAARFAWMSQILALLASFDACRGHLASARMRWAEAAASSPHGDSMMGDSMMGDPMMGDQMIRDPIIRGSGAFIELLAGNLAMVTAHAQQAQRHDPAAGPRLPVRLAAWAAMAASERGEVAEARRNLDAMTRADSRPLGVLQPWRWWAEGIMARAQGRLAAAAAILHRAADGYSAMKVWALRGFVLADLAEVTMVAGDPDATARTATCAEDNACRTGAPIHQALHQLTMAWALIGRGRHDHAARAALRAVDGFGSHGYALLAARAQVAYAHAVRRSDRRAAEDALREAVLAFDACGAVLRREQARTLLDQLESTHGTERCTTKITRGLSSLTRRERQVAELAARGYTAPQIATRLHIGVRTVETHLARSYPKLGVTSKQQLVHRAAELGFTPHP